MNSDMMKQTVEYMDSVRKQFLVQNAVYITTTGNTCTIPVTQGKSVFRIRNENGATICIYARDFIVSKSDLSVTPTPFDRILLNGVTYEVTAPPGVPVYRISGTDNVMLRIHTAAVNF